MMDGLNDQVRRIIQEAIASLEAIGMTNQAALSLLMIQSAIRMRDSAEARKTMQEIESQLDVDDDD